jgi:branched-chain amino acid transport system substrate-binding protein
LRCALLGFHFSLSTYLSEVCRFPFNLYFTPLKTIHHMKRTLLLAGAVAALSLGISSCKKTTTPKKVVNISGLFSLTGNWSTLGINSKAAIQFAADDINTYLKNKDAGFTVSVSVYDTKLDADSAQLDFVKATSSGDHFIIGPQSSAELAAIAPLADAGKMVVVSQGSTAGSLAIPGDAVFRFCPPDKVEGAAIAATIYKNGVKGLVTVARNDAGNLGLQTATGAAFTAKGGVVSAIPAYSTTLTDFTSLIATIKTSVNQYVATYGMSNTAIYIASFDEGAELFAAAASDPVLSQVKWYGGDGIALSAVLIANTPASDFAIKTNFFAPSFGLPVSGQSKWQPIADRIKASTGVAADAFALAAYDAMWVIAHTLEATEGSTNDFATLKSGFVTQSNAYTGATGPTTLDANGDRASGSFDYWGISKTGTTYTWTVVGESE